MVKRSAKSPLEPDGFADAQPGAVEELDERSVAGVVKLSVGSAPLGCGRYGLFGPGVLLLRSLIGSLGVGRHRRADDLLHESETPLTVRRDMPHGPRQPPGESTSGPNAAGARPGLGSPSYRHYLWCVPCEADINSETGWIGRSRAHWGRIPMAQGASSGAKAPIREWEQPDKDSANIEALVWCGGWDSNPHALSDGTF